MQPQRRTKQAKKQNKKNQLQKFARSTENRNSQHFLLVHTFVLYSFLSQLIHKLKFRFLVFPNCFSVVHSNQRRNYMLIFRRTFNHHILSISTHEKITLHMNTQRARFEHKKKNEKN